MSKNPNPTNVQDKDFDLVRSINAGQIDRFPELVDRYQQSLYNFACRMCGDPSEAEDAVQDTFLNIFKYLQNFRYETKFKNWMYRIATTSCLKRRRKSKFAPDRELSLEEFMPRDAAEVPSQIPDWAAVPLDKLLNDELSNKIREAILALPEKYRVVIVLRDIEGFSTEEAAQILNLTAANIKVRLHRARLYLREELKDYFDDDR